MLLDAHPRPSRPRWPRCFRFLADRWCRWPRRPAPLQRRNWAAAPALADEDAAEADTWRGGCGWFDSSHDLATGLTVEALVPEVAPPALPPAVWLLLACAAPPQPAGQRPRGDAVATG